MRKRYQRGTAALEFCLGGVFVFTLMFAIYDLGRYVITMQSLRMLANAGARATMINCYTLDVIQNQPFTNCLVYHPLPDDAAKQAVAPFLYAGGLTPTLSIACAVGAGVTAVPTGCALAPTMPPGCTFAPLPANGVALIVSASSEHFTMVFRKIWGTALDAPCASTSIPFQTHG
jgi:hypothetical protein